MVLREWKSGGEEKTHVETPPRRRPREWMSPWKRQRARKEESQSPQNEQVLAQQKIDNDGNNQGNGDLKIPEHDRIRQQILDEIITLGKIERRPDRISITVHRSSQKEHYGCTLFREAQLQEGDVDPIRIQSVGDDLNETSSSGLLNFKVDDFDTRSVLRVNDILESVNGMDCSGKLVSEVAQCMRELVGKVTFVFSTVPLSQAPIYCQSIAVRPQNNCHDNRHNDKEGEQEEAVDSQLDDTMASFSNHGLVFRKEKQEDYLSVARFNSDGWLTGTLLERGSLVLSIGQSISVMDVDATDAQSLLETHIQCRPFVSMTTLAPTLSQRRWHRIRKTTKAVGGGTMVGIGAAIMVTPLHPLGHAMAIGGAGLLGSEFDGAKKVMNKAKERLTPKKGMAGQQREKQDNDDA